MVIYTMGLNWEFTNWEIFWGEQFDCTIQTVLQAYLDYDGFKSLTHFPIYTTFVRGIHRSRVDLFH